MCTEFIDVFESTVIVFFMMITKHVKFRVKIFETLRKMYFSYIKKEILYK